MNSIYSIVALDSGIAELSGDESFIIDCINDMLNRAEITIRSYITILKYMKKNPEFSQTSRQILGDFRAALNRAINEPVYYAPRRNNIGEWRPIRSEYPKVESDKFYDINNDICKKYNLDEILPKVDAYDIADVQAYIDTRKFFYVNTWTDEIKGSELLTSDYILSSYDDIYEKLITQFSAAVFIVSNGKSSTIPRHIDEDINPALTIIGKKLVVSEVNEDRDRAEIVIEKYTDVKNI